MTMMPGERVHPANVVDILEVTGMRMSVPMSRSKSSVDFIRLLNSKGFHCRDGESQLHINIRTDEFMLRPRLRWSAIRRSLSKWEQRHNISDRHPANVTLLATTSTQKRTWWGYGIESVSTRQEDTVTWWRMSCPPRWGLSPNKSAAATMKAKNCGFLDRRRK